MDTKNKRFGIERLCIGLPYQNISSTKDDLLCSQNVERACTQYMLNAFLVSELISGLEMYF